MVRDMWVFRWGFPVNFLAAPSKLRCWPPVTGVPLKEPGIFGDDKNDDGWITTVEIVEGFLELRTRCTGMSSFLLNTFFGLVADLSLNKNGVIRGFTWHLGKKKYRVVKVARFIEVHCMGRSYVTLTVDQLPTTRFFPCNMPALQPAVPKQHKFYILLSI